MKTVFIPGLGERKITYKNKKWLYKHCLNIDWNKIKSVKESDVVIGFSFGACLALNITCSKLILCSMTPVVFDVNKLKVQELIFINGENEDYSQSKKLYKLYKGKKKFIIIPKTGHKISKRYEKEIQKNATF